jgi:hypothetical protein
MPGTSPGLPRVSPPFMDVTVDTGTRAGMWTLTHHGFAPTGAPTSSIPQVTATWSVYRSCWPVSTPTSNIAGAALVEEQAAARWLPST